MKQWVERIEECRASGMTAVAWCEANGINIKTYHYWLRKIRVKVCDKAEIHAIVPLQIHPRETGTAITVNLGNISIKNIRRHIIRNNNGSIGYLQAY